MLKKRICVFLLGVTVLFNTLGSVVAYAQTKNQSEQVVVEEAKKSFRKLEQTPVFHLYNETLINIEKINDENIKNPMLWDLARYWDKVATKYVTTILDDMIGLSKDKNLLSFHELMGKIEKSDLKKEEDNSFNKDYLMGELAQWSISGSLFTKEEKLAIDSINVTWGKMVERNVDNAQKKIDDVTNINSRKWLQQEIDKIIKIIKEKKIDEPVLNKELSNDLSKSYLFLYKEITEGLKLEDLIQSAINISQEKDVEETIKMPWNLGKIGGDKRPSVYTRYTENIKEMDIPLNDPRLCPNIEGYNTFNFKYVVAYWNEYLETYELHFITMDI